MEIVLYSYDIALVTRWERLLTDYKTNTIYDEEKLLLVENSIIIISTDVELKNINFILKTLLKNNNKILVLDRVPKYQYAQNWLAKGVNGYGNSLMSKSFINSAIEAIAENYIWLPPQISTELLKNITKNGKSENIENNILDNLTNSEKKVAQLLKNGYTNKSISEELEISINTVKTHIKHIYEKLNVKDRLSFASLFTK